MLPWENFKNGPVGPDRAFEAFTAQLFERWLRRTHRVLQTYVLHGAGGDGGVEAFATLQDGNVIGLQAKWFPGTLNSQRVAQIRSSIEKACGTFPQLIHYCVAMPLNLTKGAQAKRVKKSAKRSGGERRKGGVERWEELVESVTIVRPNLVIDRWDESRLFRELAAPGNQEIRALWFDHQLTMEALRRSWDRVKARLGNRYVPDLHATGQIEDTVASDVYDATRVAERIEAIETAGALFPAARLAIGAFSSHTAGRYGQLASLMETATADLEWLESRVQPLLAAQSCGPDVDLPEMRQAMVAVRALRREMDRLKQTSGYFTAADLCGRSLTDAVAAQETLSIIAAALRNARSPRLIVGPPGCGKTHALAHVVHSAVDAGAPAVCILCHPGDDFLDFMAVLQRALDTPGWSVGRMLDALEALALLTAAQCHLGQPVFVRTLLVIDGLEETASWTNWKDHLAELRAEAAHRPRLHVVLSMRPETAAALALNETAAYSILALSEGANVDLPRLLTRYSRAYDVALDAVPWLGWALRSPLEIRLFVEEFSGREVTAEQSASANLLSLFSHKLRRIEEEARLRSGQHTWSAGIGLTQHLLEQISAATADSSVVTQDALIGRVRPLDDEFTAQRIRIGLSTLVDHGLVTAIPTGTPGFGSAPPNYIMSHRHIADYVVARRAAESVMELRRRGELAEYPKQLESRGMAAKLFAAMLLEEGFAVTDAIWTTPGDFRALLVASLPLVSPRHAASRESDVRDLVLRSTQSNRFVLRAVVTPVARIPGHRLGPRLLDAVLRAARMVDRDPIWSVPDDLAGPGRWEGDYDATIETLELVPEIDDWDCMPLLFAWVCSSVVEQRRSRAREALAVWGAARLDQMAKLLEHMAIVDDPQICADVTVAAFGAALGAPTDDVALIELARVVSKLFFVDPPRVRTADVVVRVAARGIVERAALLYPESMAGLIESCRPPYQSKIGWPLIDREEACRTLQDDGPIISGDLSWYVANRCFRAFEHEESPAGSRPMRLHAGLVSAIADGQIDAPRSVRELVALEPSTGDEDEPRRDDDRASLLESIRGQYDESVRIAGQEAQQLDDAELWRWAARQPSERPRTHSLEFNALLESARTTTGIGSIKPLAVRNGMLAHIVRSWGWSRERFDFRKFDDPVTTVDHAILRTHGGGATHGERSAVGTFREKYVWAAVNQLAGELSDRLPVWDEDSQEWQLLRSYEDICSGLPDPLPRTRACLSDPYSGVIGWESEGLWPAPFRDEPDLALRAERWLTEGTLPDPCAFVLSCADQWDEAVALGLELFRQAHQSCLDQMVEVRAFGVASRALPLVLRDAAYLFGSELYRTHAWIEEGVYVSPAVACWAPWLTWRSEEYSYTSFDGDGLVQVSLPAMLGEIMTRFDDEDGLHEPDVWLPSPLLQRHFGIVGMHGDRYVRRYCDLEGVASFVERDLPARRRFNHHYLATGLRGYLDFCRVSDLTPLWCVRVWLEASPAFLRYDSRTEWPSALVHRSRDVQWLVWWDHGLGRLQSIVVGDELTRLSRPARSGDTNAPYRE